MTLPPGPPDLGDHPTGRIVGRILSAFSEGIMVEEPAVDRLVALGWRHENLFTESPTVLVPDPRTGRTSFRQAMLLWALRSAIARLNPELDGTLSRPCSTS